MLTFALIAATVLVSWLAFERPALLNRLILWPPAIDRSKQYDRLLTHGFIHADWSHLLFNMITLYFFGRVIEREISALIGPVGFVLFYLSAIVIAILPTYLRHRHDPHYRSLGSSGAVSAVLFAFILLQPWSLIFIPIPVPAFLYAIGYMAYSFWMDRRGGDNINHSAHLSGAIYGVLFMLFMDPGVGADFVQRLLNPRWG
ncbi:membrane associated rhomboid family serine protease [Lysobacter niastensis]|uniref:Membrane associated rhomboid family serine protease n=1 Tax=Lysobacter niastensis TaxID=380629 RepID=A0ABU1WEB1_9GAMM|nr:rhomboid family intramembrane serine protease [Lysobacter niastensis]MDR7135941.1 membrane associated rhomboid family serine protease [Lysobacter niastensis]